MRTANQFLTHVRQITQDFSEATGNYTNGEILDTAYTAFGPIWESLKLSLQDYMLSEQSFQQSDFLQVGSDQIWELTLPETMGAIRIVKTRPETASRRGQIIPMADLVDAEDGQPFQVFWAYAGSGLTDKIRIYSPRAVLGQIVIWYIRRMYPMHYGIAQGGSATTLVFDTTSTLVGEVIRRSDVYVGAAFEITTDTTTPGNVGARREVIAWDGTTATFAALPNAGTVTAGVTGYDLLTPVTNEADNYMAHETAENLIARSFDTASLSNVASMTAKLRERFMAGIRERTPDMPITLRMNQ